MTQTEEKPVEVKQEAEKQETSDDSNNTQRNSILSQVEYYFGDVNLPRDKFIKEECSKNEGWFSAPLLLTFNRVANLIKDVPQDEKVKLILNVLKESSLVDVDEEGQKIRRSPDCPLPEKDVEERSVYLKGFHRTDTTLDDLLGAFKKYPGVESVIMRYYKEKTIKTEAELQKEREAKAGASEDTTDAKKVETTSEPQLVWVRKFKGSIFVIFKTVEQAKKLMEDDTPEILGNKIVAKMWHSEYKAMKTTEYQTRLASRKNKRGGKESENKNAKDSEKIMEECTKGALIKVLDVPEGFTREILKEKWFAVLDKDKFEIAYIDFNKGDKNAVLRLSRENAGKEALEAIPDKKLVMEEAKEGKEAVTSAVEGFDDDEEAKYMVEVSRQRESRGKRKMGGGRGGGRGGKRRRRY